MMNPYRRLLSECGVTQQQFLRAAELSRPTLVFILNGTYQSLSDRMIVSLGRLCAEKGIDARSILEAEYKARTLQEAYLNWRISERAMVAAKYDVAPPEVFSKDQSPFDSYVSKTAGSRQRFIKDLKVDAAATQRYASGKSESMPISLQDAFEDIGYRWLPHLIAMQHNWRSEHT